MSGISYLIMKLLGRTGLTAADRILGLFFGMGLGGLIVAVIIFLAGFTAFPQEPWWEESKLVDPFEHISIWSSHYLPESITDYRFEDFEIVGYEYHPHIAAPVAV